MTGCGLEPSRACGPLEEVQYARRASPVIAGRQLVIRLVPVQCSRRGSRGCGWALRSWRRAIGIAISRIARALATAAAIAKRTRSQRGHGAREAGSLDVSSPRNQGCPCCSRPWGSWMKSPDDPEVLRICRYGFRRRWFYRTSEQLFE